MNYGLVSIFPCVPSAYSHWNEEDRLRALDSYEILDTPIEEDFEDIVKMAAHVCGAPVSVINFIAGSRQWFKAEKGLGVRETPLDVSICAKAILQPGIFTVPDLSKDSRFQHNPLITGDPRLRFYAGALLETPEGLPLGTMCVLDFKPRTLTTHEAEILKSLARQVMTLLELRHALNAKSRSEERLNLALEASGFLGVWEWDIMKDRVYADHRFISAFGGEPSWSTEGAPIADYLKAIHPEDLLRVSAVIERAMFPNESFKQEYRLVQKDGSSIWIEARGKCHFDESGKPIRFPGVAVEVTERRQAQARSEFLSRLTQKLSLLSAPEEINRVATSEVGQFLGGNRCYFFEALPPDLSCKVLTDWHIQGLKTLKGNYDLALFGEPEMWKTLNTTSVCIHDSGQHPWTNRSADAYGSLEVKSVWIVPFLRDRKWVTCLGVSSNAPRSWTSEEREFLENFMLRVWPLIERARIELILRESEEAFSRIAAVIESSDDAILTKSLDGIILSWNAGAERIFGYKPDEIIGKSILRLIPIDLQSEEPVIISRLKNGQRIEHYETVRVGKGGRKIDISLTVSPVKDRYGKIVAASKIARDITHEKRRQEALRESETRFRVELERLVNERTAALQEAVAQMEEFSYSVSHDLRAPLRAMQGYATALLEDYREKIDAEGLEYLTHIANASTRMERLTHDVLVYSKIPRTTFQPQPIDLDKLVSDIVRHNLPGEAKARCINIEKPLLSVLGNESFLSQSVSNLIDNAVKFASKERPLRVRIWSEQHQEQIRLWVEDNGIGILPEHQARVWGMFERVHPRNLYEGTGIGLAIVRKTVERMNGTVGLHSDGITGSTFWIQLPGII